MDFYSAYRHGFARVAACTHHTSLADPPANAESVLRLAQACHDDGVAVAVFPELTMSGYSIEDILLQDALLESVEEALIEVVAASVVLTPVLVVGAPLRHRHRIYNTAVVIHRGAVLGVAPKSYLPTYREFYERRQLAAGDDVRDSIRVAGAEVPFGPDLLFVASDLPGLVLHVEVCEDMFVPIPPSAQAALAGATVLANLSGSPITVGRAEDRALLARSAARGERLRLLELRAGKADAAVDERDLGAHALEFDAKARVVEPYQFGPPPDGGADARGHGDDARRQLGGDARLLLRHHGGGRAVLGIDGDLGERSRRPFGRAQRRGKQRQKRKQDQGEQSDRSHRNSIRKIGASLALRSAAAQNAISRGR